MSRRSHLIWAAAFAFGGAISLHAAIAADTLQAKGGAITIQPVNHAALQLKQGNTVITVDPTPQGGDYAALPKADVILITDIHGDHMNADTIAKASKADTTVVVPQAVETQLKKTTDTVINNGETKTIKGVKIEAVAMYNLQRGPSAGQLFHTK